MLAYPPAHGTHTAKMVTSLNIKKMMTNEHEICEVRADFVCLAPARRHPPGGARTRLGSARVERSRLQTRRRRTGSYPTSFLAGWLTPLSHRPRRTRGPRAAHHPLRISPHHACAALPLARAPNAHRDVHDCKILCAAHMAAPILSNDAGFLQDQVLRLSSELARAQGKPLTIAAEDAEADWLSGAAQMPPLLRSYDARLSDLERSEASQRGRAEAAETELRMMQQTSDRMRVELQNALEANVRNETLTSRSSSSSSRPDPMVNELQERLDVLYQENEILCEQQRETGDELERLRGEKLAQAHDHMSLVKQISALRDELIDSDARARKAADSRDRAREELGKCAAELVAAQENTQSAMAIAERHAAERDAALASVGEHRKMLEALNGRAATDREALSADLAVARRAEGEIRQRAQLLEANVQSTAKREHALVERLQACTSLLTPLGQTACTSLLTPLGQTACTSLLTPLGPGGARPGGAAR